MMDWVQFFGLLVPLVALFGFLYRELKDWRGETREEMAKSDKIIEGIREEIRQQGYRSDHLYQVLLDIQKESSQRFMDMQKASEKQFMDMQKNMDQRFMDMQKESSQRFMDMQKNTDQKFYDLLKEKHESR